MIGNPEFKLWTKIQALTVIKIFFGSNLKKIQSRFEPYLSSEKSSDQIKAQFSDSRRLDYQRDRDRFEKRRPTDGKFNPVSDPSDLRNKLNKSYRN